MTNPQQQKDFADELKEISKEEESILETFKNFSDWLNQIECELLEVTYTLGSLDRVCEDNPELLSGYEKETAALNVKLDEALDEVRLLMRQH